MLSAAARQLAPALLRHEGAAAAPLRRLASAAAPTKPEEEDEYFELLPPGCSMKDPTYHYGRNRRARLPPQPNLCHPPPRPRRRSHAPALCSPCLTSLLAFTWCSLSDPVLNYDQKPVEDYKPLKKRQPVPAPPLNVAVRCKRWEAGGATRGLDTP